MNVDAATGEIDDVNALGDVIRDHEGTVIACWAMRVKGGFSTAVGELLAI